MKELMEVWRRKVLDAEEEEVEQELTIDVDAVPGEFKPGDRVRFSPDDDEDVGIDAQVNDEADEDDLEEVKKNCHDYNPYHGADDGRFVDPDKHKGSYSMKSGDGDCSWGQSSRKGANRSRQAVKQPCGRGAKHRCKDGSEKWEEGVKAEGVEQQDAAYIRGIITQELRTVIQQQMKKTGCGYNEIIKAINMIAAAEKGELFGKDKK